jgi:hypothetical protein
MCRRPPRRGHLDDLYADRSGPHLLYTVSDGDAEYFRHRSANPDGRRRENQ